MNVFRSSGVFRSEIREDYPIRTRIHLDNTNYAIANCLEKKEQNCTRCAFFILQTYDILLQKYVLILVQNKCISRSIIAAKCSSIDSSSAGTCWYDAPEPFSCCKIAQISFGSPKRITGTISLRNFAKHALVWIGISILMAVQIRIRIGNKMMLNNMRMRILHILENKENTIYFYSQQRQLAVILFS